MGGFRVKFTGLIYQKPQRVKTRASIHGCMSTETTSISLQKINISRFLYFRTEDTILVQFQEKIEKGGFQKNIEVGVPPLILMENHILY